MEARGAAEADPVGAEEVTTAFALGWQMAELFKPAGAEDGEARLPSELPSVATLPAAERRALRFDQIDAALARLREPIAATGLSPPTTEALRQVPGEEAERGRRTVLATHVELMRVLIAADFRLGKAYGLGRALFDTCHPETEADLNARLDRGNLSELYSWSLDLKTVLPAHAGEAVYKSLQQWQRWGQRPTVHGRALDWDRDEGAVKRSLARQGEIYRALLSGEKQATDTLAPSDYVDAARRLFDHAVQLLRRIPKRIWLPLAALFALALAGLVVAAVLGSGSGVLAALGGLAASLGISWTSVRHGLGEVAAALRAPLWGAELDAAIVVAITRVRDLTRA